MTLTANAILGTLTLTAGVDSVEPGSDSDWNLDPKTAITSNLGATTDHILELSRGSHLRSFTVWMPPARFLLLKALLRTVQSFTDWSGDTRNVYVETVHRETGSRPFLVKCSVVLREQP